MISGSPAGSSPTSSPRRISTGRRFSRESSGSPPIAHNGSAVSGISWPGSEGNEMTRVTHAALVAILLTVPVLVERAAAHHGAGRYDPRQKVELQGTLTRVDFVNPHTYIYFDVVGPDGKVIAMQCETRGATVLRRSGWSPEMFVRGASIKVTGSPHRDDPTACTVDTMTVGDKPTLER